MSDTVFECINVQFPGGRFRNSHSPPKAHVHSELFRKCFGDPGVRCCFKLLLAQRKPPGVAEGGMSPVVVPNPRKPIQCTNCKSVLEAGFECQQFSAELIIPNSPWVLHSSSPNHLPTHCVTISRSHIMGRPEPVCRFEPGTKTSQNQAHK